MKHFLNPYNLALFGGLIVGSLPGFGFLKLVSLGAVLISIVAACFWAYMLHVGSNFKLVTEQIDKLGDTESWLVIRALALVICFFTNAWIIGAALIVSVALELYLMIQANKL